MKSPTISECNCRIFDCQNDDFQHEMRSSVSVKDQGSSPVYRYENKSGNHLAKYKVDGGLIADNDKKCDFLLLNCEQKKAFFIELKGSDISRAIKQVTRSIDFLQSRLKGFDVFARIVLRRDNTTKLSIDNKVKKLQEKVKALNGNLKKGTALQDII